MRAFAARALAAGLCVAAIAAIAALAVGEFEETHLRVVGTSLGFSVASALAAAGESLRRRGGGRSSQALGGGTTCAAIIAYGLLLVLIWSDASEGLARAFGISVLLALWGSHASLVIGARRPGDTPLVEGLVLLSVAAGTIDTAIGQVALLGLVEDVDEAVVRLVAVVLVVLLLSTALPPVLRRAASGPAVPDEPPLTAAELVDALNSASLRLERLAVTDDRLHREAEALRRLAQRVPR